ncbi:MAG TPA: heavy metal-binding domain-containing protein [Vicinamibacteria bacterium]|nr:heavy metal-binding domain-containing protein [Vicinamibacteria bacterium]HRB12221.1 heavy metal-binding domain-containing protein [Vicinamibacteria bacterium]
MISRRLFLISLSSTLPLSGCASIPPDTTRRTGGVADPTGQAATPWQPPASAKPETPPPAPPAAAGERYTCSMHPEIDLPAPGVCPKCGMPLVPKKPGGSR